MKIAIVGLGLIGGSMARDLSSQINVEVYGVEENPEHIKVAEGLGLVSGFMSLEEAERECEVIILAIPVTAIEQVLPGILNRILPNKIVIDLGSTKSAICANVASHPNRSQYVASHPLAGTEFSGPTAALRGLFNNKKNIICEPEKSAPDAVEKAIAIFNSVGLNTITMDAEDHDKHLAYVSHLSHVSSFMLGLTVLNIENDEKQIFNLASTGFESTVRLAKSNPHTWYPIFSKNKKHVSKALGSYIDLLNTFKLALDIDDEDALKNYMVKANDIKRILNN